MICTACPSPDWQDLFVRMLPAIRKHARIAFRHHDPESREELVQAVDCNACCAVARLAELDVPTPDPVGGVPIKAGDGINAGASSHSNPANNATAAPAADQWRYRWLDGHWWYWTPENRWLWYSNDGHWNDYCPEVAVGVRPYGNVNVGAGRRIGVDVWGDHGAVRVGRIYIGW